MNLFYFGPPPNQLFGCYHQPETTAERDCAIVLCYPVAPEYARTHRAVRHLAIRLSKAGFPVLRFDYSGNGDSGGESDKVELGHWLNDLSTAIDEVRRQSGRRRICIIGLRLGA
ncbi:MAG: alpha/beta hydrolase, partial [Verrucomicrobiota bacterium]